MQLKPSHNPGSGYVELEPIQKEQRPSWRNYGTGRLTVEASGHIDRHNVTLMVMESAKDGPAKQTYAFLDPQETRDLRDFLNHLLGE